MKISFIGHAAILVETKGVRILSDPWWQGPCFGAQWWIHPEPWLDPLEVAAPDFIYISHGHSDHLHPGTLRRMPTTAKILVSRENGIADGIAAMGFEVIALAPKEIREIAPGLKVEITPTYNDDTLMVIDDGEQVCFNLNDAVHALTEPRRSTVIQDLSARYGQVDYVFCGYGTASHFPNCYEIPGKDYVASAGQRQQHFNRAWAAIIAALEPRHAFPFAADVVFLENELFWMNEPIHNSERPTDVFRTQHPESATKVHDIAPGFVIENGEVAREILFSEVSNDALKREKAKDIETANKTTTPTREQVEELTELVRRNVEVAGSYLREYAGDYRTLIRLKGSPHGIGVTKSGSTLTVAEVDNGGDDSAYDLVFITRFSYLRRLLTSAHGYEVIFVGSGGIFRYRDRAALSKKIHRELAVLLRQVNAPPASRFGTQPKWLFDMKQLVKRALGRKSEDLYDLERWTVFEQA